jgi:Rrf2 family nitric oxide-sensitive transcriptional repressor
VLRLLRRRGARVKLTAFTDYSLRVLMYLGTEPGRRATIAEIAQVYGISENHLTKVVHFLGKSGWLAGVRGKGGGIALARPLAEIRLGDVVRAAEGESMPAECFDAGGGDCCIAPACRLRGVLQGAFDAFYAALDRHTLEDLVGNRERLIQFLPRLQAHARAQAAAN